MPSRAVSPRLIRQADQPGEKRENKKNPERGSLILTQSEEPRYHSFFSMPKVSLVKFKSTLAELAAEFILKTEHSIMIFLAIDVIDDPI